MKHTVCKIVERNPIFAPVWESKLRYLVLKGSAGSGKSVDTATRLVIRIASQVGRNLLCVRKVAESNETSTYNELRKAINRLGLGGQFTATRKPLKIVCRNGNEILFGGVKDDSQREKLKSITAANGSLTDVWIEEATELTQDDFEIIDDRLRGRLPNGYFYQLTLTFNPVSAAHWIKRAFFDRADPDVLCHHSTYKDNFFCDEAYYRRMERRREVDPEGYRIYGLGEWGETGGLILTNFIVEDFDIDPARFDQVSYGQDFGYNHANVVLQLGIKDGEIYICRQIYVREKITSEIIAMAADWDKSFPMHCDSAETDRIVEWRRAGWRATGVNKHHISVNYAIDWLKKRKIHIHPDCAETIKEIQQWRWQKDKDGNYTDNPVPFGDDAMAALRYGCEDWIPKKEVTANGKKEEPHYNFKSERPRPSPAGFGEKVRII